MRIHRLLLLCQIAVALGVTTGAVGVANALAQEQSSISIEHQPPRAEQLPFPGQPVVLDVAIRGTRAFTDPLRVLATIDGKLIDMRAEKSTLTEYDVPVYQVTLHAPVAALSYQFLLYRKDGTFISSDRFEVQRACLPSLAVSTSDTTPPGTGAEKVSALEVEAKRLERDGQGYRRTLKLLQQLQDHLKEQGQ
jgi:hypothetical protein